MRKGGCGWSALGVGVGVGVGVGRDVVEGCMQSFSLSRGEVVMGRF